MAGFLPQLRKAVQVNHENCGCDISQTMHAAKAWTPLEIQFMIQKSSGSCFRKSYVNEKMELEGW